MKKYVVESSVNLVFRTKIYRKGRNIYEAARDVENVLLNIIKDNDILKLIVDKNDYVDVRIVSKTSEVNNI